MKLHKALTIQGAEHHLVSHNVRLSLRSPGSAFFTLSTIEKPTGLVQFYCGYKLNHLQPWFTGFIETATKVNEKTYRIFCRELSAVLFYRLPLALRSVTVGGVLAATTEQTGLVFTTPEARYTKAVAPAFYNLGNGYQALDNLGRVFDYPKPIWQQSPSGGVFVGSWSDTASARKPVEVPSSWEVIAAQNSATLPPLPSLRPGVLYNGAILTAVEFKGMQMQITWEQDPWKR